MGIHFNQPPLGFQEAIKSEYYVDKTGIIALFNKRLGTAEKCVAISHARRFGKSQIASTLSAYYSMGEDTKAYFEPYAISKDESFLIHLNG